MTIQSSLKKGLVGHWTMDDSDTSNGTLYDKSAYDNHANLENNVLTSQPGKIKQSYSFDRSTNAVTIRDTDRQLSVTQQDFTVSLWANIPSGASTDTAQAFSQNIPSSWSDKLFIFYVGDSSGDDIRIWWETTALEHSTEISGEGWKHFVLTKSGTNLELFENGSFVSSATTNNNKWESTFTGIGAGNNRGSLSQFFNGRLDDVRVYDRILSESEISGLYNMRSQPQQNLATLMNTTVNGKDVTLQNDSFGSWICVQNYEHYGGNNPSVSPGSTFPQLPDGDRLISDIESDGQNGELRHVDNISQYGNWEVDAVRLEAETSNHSRKINYYSKNQSVIDSVVDNSADVGHSELKSSIEKYPDHTSFLPDNMAADNDNQTNGNSNRIFGFEFPMFGDGSDGTRVHWAMAGNGSRWEVDDFPSGPGQTTIHRVWVRTELF